ncbi:O-antigen ligase family protein [Microbacterium aurantiacum]|uniref:O-antigen ligase family protein n=1 Tax=Microbacterium aurantiacum TaxID=162393 RepID=UPI000C80682B|nr:O-antigen ligase family protein [Microbacterium aurantiacum]
MKFSPVVPLSKFGRVTRSLILVGMLVGNLFPTVGGIGIALISTVLAAPVVVYELIRWLPRFHPVVLFVVPLFAIIAVHAWVVAPTSLYGQDKFEKWITATLISAVAACLIRDKAALLTFTRAWLCAALILSALSIAGFQGGRAETFDSNPIWLGRAISFAIIAIIWMMWQRHIRLVWAIPSVLILAVGLITTGSRGPLLSVAAAAIVMALFSGRRRIAKVLAISGAGGLAYWAVAELPFFAESRFKSLLSEGFSDQAREMFWRITLPVIEEYPGGVGFGNWAAHAHAPAQFFYPHNIFLEIFGEFGIIVGVIFVVVVLAVLLGLIRRSGKDPVALVVLALFVGELVSVNVSGDLNARTFFFMLTLGFLTAVRSVISIPEDADADSADAGADSETGSSTAHNPESSLTSAVRTTDSPHRRSGEQTTKA